ncbi:hypothetical protein [Fructilactobacillus fructivorans]|uniref:hypothetical protein n=1 Tax=Fructilactobacillus fructivorans TaxID=1614 RepID=UPI0002196FA2|nr:hypothetical protein [Fructilactobacillus fructivorans]
MQFLGIDVTEWASVLSILVPIVTFVVWVFNQIVVKPLRTSMNNLSETLSELSKTFKERDEQISNDIDQQKLKLKEHDVRIKNLEKEDEKSEKTTY